MDKKSQTTSKKITMKENDQVKYCTRCVSPRTRPNLKFNEEGVCYACLNFDKRKSVDWSVRLDELKAICDSYRKNDGTYDCLIPVSGGKDSYFLVYMLREVMGMNPLLMTVGCPFSMTEAGKHNFNNIGEAFDCDHILFNVSPARFRSKTRADFEKDGHVLKYIESEIYRIPHQIAELYGLEFVMYAEDADYHLGLTDIEKSHSKDGDYFMSYFVPWEGRHNLEIAKRYGFKDLTHEWNREGSIEDYYQIDSIGYMVHLWMKYPKFGYACTTDIATLWVRRGFITREEGFKLIREKDHKLDQRALDDFINFCGYTTKEFWDITERFWNRELFEKIDGVWKLRV